MPQRVIQCVTLANVILHTVEEQVWGIVQSAYSERDDVWGCASQLLGGELDRAVGGGGDHGGLWEWELLSRECRDAGTDGGVLAKELRATLTVINIEKMLYSSLSTIFTFLR